MKKAPAATFLDLRRPPNQAHKMPIFYPPSQMRHLPLTPPEYYDDFAQYGKAKPHHFGYSPYDDLSQNPFMMNAGNYYIPSMAEQQARYENEMKRQARANYQAQMQKEHIYGPIAAPVLPPLRVADQAATEAAAAAAAYRASAHAHAQAPAAAATTATASAPPKEEKSAGGVAAHLDYDMDTMVDFVAEMATGMFQLYVSRAYLADYNLVRSIQPSRKAVEAKFRSYVSSVLTSTRLPKATILLAMHYLSGRMIYQSAQNQIHHRLSNALYHLLTVGLMLASKFLDDNTFQNRSWAEVSNLSVKELNTREADWLAGMAYRLHVDWEEAHGVRAWFERWDEYEGRKKSDLSLETLKLSPIDTSLRSYQRTSRYSPPGTFSPPESDPGYEGPTSAQTRHSLSPPSARHTAVNTPDFYPSVRNAVSYMELRQPQPFHQRQQQQQHFQMQPQTIDPQLATPTMTHDVQGELVYTRESPLYGPGYVLETRSNGMCTWNVHNFVGVNYTQQYAAQLQIGWCEMHRRLDCMDCTHRPAMAMGMQAIAA